MLFKKKPKSYYGAFSFFFKSKLYLLFIVYISVVLIISFAFSFFYNLSYAGPSSINPICINWLHKWYFSLMTFMSPGFTEFLPVNDVSRILSAANGLLGLSFNALFLSILVARALQPHEPFEIVPFLLYDPEVKKLSARFYSTLPSSCYNLSFRLFRFLMYENEFGKQLGATREINISPNYKNVLLPNYGILLRADIDLDKNHQHASSKRVHKRKKIPVEWLLPEHEKCPDGHFYLTIEAETPYGKMFQTINFYLLKNDIKIGRHKLLNEGEKLSLDNWYKWKSYRWDLWGKYSKIPNITNFENDLIVKRYQ